MSPMNDYVTQDQLKETLKENNAELTKNIVDQMPEVMGDMMHQIDHRFNKIESRMDEIENKINRLVNTIDGFVKRLDENETENAARDAQFERLVTWAKEVSEKTGISMPQL